MNFLKPLIFICLISSLLYLAESTQKPGQCPTHNKHDIILEISPTHSQNNIDFSPALFPDAKVLNLTPEDSESILPTLSDDIPRNTKTNKPSNADGKNRKPLVSFEEWQKKVSQNDKDRKPKRKSSSNEGGLKKQQMVDSVDGGFSEDFGSMLEELIGASKEKQVVNVYSEREYISPSGSTKPEKKQPLDVRNKSLKERFNYASIDCAATVRKANKQAKGAQSILYESKDQYLLNRCSADKFVIINLCEQIVVDTIVMANFEFFSSTFKDFRVYASSKYPTEEWKLLGQWQARNTRDLQVFKVPDSGFVEYLKIEFLTHYGHEYYCPLSLVRVHGMTMMEYYTLVESQDQGPFLEDEHLWPAEVREQIIQPQFNITNTSESFPVKVEVEEEDTKPTISPEEVVIEPFQPLQSHPEVLDLSLINNNHIPVDSNIKQKENTLVGNEKEDREETAVKPDAALEGDREPLSSMTSKSTVKKEVDEELFIADSSSADNSSSTQLPLSHTKTASSSSSSSSSPTTETTLDENHVESTHDSNQKDSEEENKSAAAENSVGSTSTTTQANVQATVPHIPPKVAIPGYPKEGSTQESIYKTIMKRLSVLEHDMVLSQRFLDDQNKVLNDMFIDMEKKHQDQLILLIGHLNETASQKIENMKRRYEQWYEDLKEQNENDIRELTSKISILADQLSFERRVSVSQLIIMIISFVFMALSRGTFSTLSPVMAAQQQERKRRESIDQATNPAKEALDILINKMKSEAKDAVVPSIQIKGKNTLVDESAKRPSETPTPKKPHNPRRHSDSPYHTMGDIDLHLPTTSTVPSRSRNTISPSSHISRTSSIDDFKNESDHHKTNRNKSRVISRNPSNDSLKPSLQGEILLKKLDGLLIEHQQSQEKLEREQLGLEELNKVSNT